MSVTIKTKYLGGLRTESTHLKSGNVVISDAPLDNNGKGEAFSPTDLLATSLATCMITVMGMQGLNIDGIDCAVTKIMALNPRRVAEVIVELNFPKNDFSEQQKQMLRDAAYSCPVAMSLHPDLKKNVIFNF